MRGTRILVALIVGCGSLISTLAGAAAPADSARVRAGLAARRPALPPPQVSGYVQIHFRHAFPTGTDSLVDNDDFRVQRVRIALKGDLSPRVSYEVEVDPRAPDITGVLRDAHVTLHYLPRHDLRIGQQKTAFGYENRESSTDLYHVNRAELSDAISRGSTLRDIGVGLMGNWKLGRGFRIEDAITVVNGAGMNVQADDTPRKNVWARAGLRYRNDARDAVVRLGTSIGTGDFLELGDDLIDPADDFRVGFDRRGYDFELDHPRFALAAEYASSKDENQVTHEVDEPIGYYVSAVAKFSRGFGPTLRYDVLDDSFKRWTLGAFAGLPAAPLRAFVNYERREIKDGVRGDDKLYLWMQVRF